MKPEAMLKELETAAQSMGVKVSYEALGSSVGMGGLCRVKGQYRVIIDKRASARERLATLAQSLCVVDLDAVQALEVSGPVRDVLEFYSVRRAS